VHVLPVPRHLPIERGAVIAVVAITFDFGNTLVQVDRASSRNVIATTADVLAARGVVQDPAAFLEAWAEERDRQFREEVPQFREVDVQQRAVRVLARLRGVAAPREEDRWDDAAAALLADPAEVDLVVEAYSSAFVAGMSPVPDAATTLEALAARGFRLAILSNWPLALTIDRFAEAQGWLPFLHAIVVSQRVGTIKPHPSIFRAAEAALGLEGDPGAILHVGDDWAADVVGAKAVGWCAAYLASRPDDSPLPGSTRNDEATPDLELATLDDLEAGLDTLA
jgi:putative hydrolase of the HAD superfamily